MSGVLVLVGTPIGNLGDLSPRAVEALRTADVIACEDTRRTRQLLTAAGVPAGGRLMAVHDHNEAAQVGGPAGPPRRRPAGGGGHRRGDARHLRPRASAWWWPRPPPATGSRWCRDRRPPIAALVVSGLPTGRSCFEGFLPRKGRDRARRLAELAAERRTTVLFESPRRVRATVADLAEALGGERRVAVARELTKRFEEVWRGTLAEAVDHLAEQGAARRIRAGRRGCARRGSRPPSPTWRTPCGPAWPPGVPRRDAVAEVAAELDVPKRQVYDAALRLG